MWVIINNIIPFRGFLAITFWPFIFARRTLNEVDINHESIHGGQQLEVMLASFLILLPLILIGLSAWLFLCVLLIFYVWYILEYFIRGIMNGGNWGKAYKEIAFEQEAYGNEENLDYLKSRKLFSWLKCY